MLVLTSSAVPIHRQLTGRPVSEGMAAEATAASRSFTLSTRWEVSRAAQAAAALPTPSQPLWKLPASAPAGMSDCQATCSSASPGRSGRVARKGSTRLLLE